MLGSLRLRQVSIALFALLLLLAGGLAVGLRSVEMDMDRIDRSWDQFQVEFSERARLEGSLRATLGYGGLIHNFKNYVLRSQERYHANAIQDIGEGLALIRRYREINLMPGESLALDDIESTLLTYATKISIIPDLIAQGLSVHSVDTLTIVDDTIALRGLDTLRATVHSTGSQGFENKAILISELNSALGYGGAIHAYKNLILRKTATYAQATMASIAKARSVLSALRAVGTTPGEIIALDDITQVLEHYSQNIAEIQRAHALSTPITKIDRAAVVDDGPALRGILLLNQALADDIHRRRNETSHMIKTVDNRVLLFLWGATGSILLIACGIAWLIQGRIIAPIQQMGWTMTALAEGDVGLEIPYRSEWSEIGDMARALTVFRESMIRLMDRDQGLTVANEKLTAQLSELSLLKEREAAQTALANGLAENLAVARDAADRASMRAESDEKQIRAIVEAVNDAILTINERGVIETFNPAAQVIFGYRADDIIGSHIDILVPQDLNKDANLIVRYIQGDRLNAFQGGRREYSAIRRGGHVFPVELAINTIHLAETEKFTVVMADITKRKEAESEIRRLALTDPLTSLANRNQFKRRFTEALDLARRQPHWQVCLIMVDLDRFKPVNDTHGHPTGDAVLKEVAARLTGIARKSDTVARLGGDEFALILVDSGNRESVEQKAQQIVSDLSRPMTVLGKEIRIGASLGIATFPIDGEDIDTLMARADQALYAAKEAGRNTWRFHGHLNEDNLLPAETS